MVTDNASANQTPCYNIAVCDARLQQSSKHTVDTLDINPSTTNHQCVDYDGRFLVWLDNWITFWSFQWQYLLKISVLVRILSIFWCQKDPKIFKYEWLEKKTQGCLNFFKGVYFGLVDRSSVFDHQMPFVSWLHWRWSVILDGRQFRAQLR